MVPHEISHVIVLWNPQDEMNNRQQEVRRIFTEAPMAAMALRSARGGSPKTSEWQLKKSGFEQMKWFPEVWNRPNRFNIVI